MSEQLAQGTMLEPGNTKQKKIIFAVKMWQKLTEYFKLCKNVFMNFGSLIYILAL